MTPDVVSASYVSPTVAGDCNSKNSFPVAPCSKFPVPVEPVPVIENNPGDVPGDTTPLLMKVANAIGVDASGRNFPVGVFVNEPDSATVPLRHVKSAALLTEVPVNDTPSQITEPAPVKLVPFSAWTAGPPDTPDVAVPLSVNIAPFETSMVLPGSWTLPEPNTTSPPVTANAP